MPIAGMMPPMLVLTKLRKSFGELTAVDGLTLTVRKGEVFGLLGPNGAGKTTTLSIAVGLLRPDDGGAELEGLGLCIDPRVRRSIGVAPQSLAVYDALTGDENLRFFGSLYGLRGQELTDRVNGALDAVQLTDRKNDQAGTYSGGMKRRLNLAAALIHDPPLLLLDEPTAGVDPQSRASILDMVRGLRDRGKTIIYTTHYMEEAQKVCDRVGIIDRGKLLDVGTVDELIERHGGDSVVTVRRGNVEEEVKTSDPVQTLAAMVTEQGVTSVRLDRPDLEGVFLRLTGRRLRD
jgi:ABC-2 type transport system ATP-binding protein